MTDPIANMLKMLDLTKLDDNRFQGTTFDPNWKRIYGGQVLAQSLIAAERSIEGMAPHSLHGYFMLGGDPKTPLEFEVERLRDGRSFSTRGVKVLQHGKAIFTMLASFHREESGPEHSAPMPKVPEPEDLPVFQGGEHPLLMSQSKGIRLYWKRERPFDLRPTDPEYYLSREAGSKKLSFWFKTRNELDADPSIHRAALAYLSDMVPIDAILFAHNLSVFDARIQVASLDHAMWFHRPFRADEWMLFVVEKTSAGAGRGLSTGAIYSREGALVASVSQEGLIRPARPR